MKLYFDAYLPPNHGIGLPGQNSTIIRIHGGGWTTGDKGLDNMMQMNKYFAAQGYCVFDIQYGLNNESSILASLKFITPLNVQGNFSINDMVSQIGSFCQFLTVHQADYGANLSSVFISGGSAGGQLTCATALGIASGNYPSIFGTGITIRGFIPFYPANQGAASVDNNVSDPEFYNPALLVTANSPPCLDYQGSQDGLVNPAISYALQSTYTSHGNSHCAVIELPFGGHGSDLDFSGYYNSFFLYYMERFLYEYR